MVKPFSIQAPEQVAKEYGGNKQKIAEAAQLGLVDPTAAVLAGMFIDKMRSAQQMEAGQKPTIAQQVLGAPQPQASAPQGMPPQMGGGLGATPQAMPQEMSAPPEMAMPQEMPPEMGMAEGGIVGLDLPDAMFDEPNNGGYAPGGLVAFAKGGTGYNEYIDAIVAQESRGNYKARNKSSGALGRYQLMPDTARAIAARLGMEYNPALLTSDTPEAREYQDALGKSALKESWDYGKGDAGLAATYYHAGPNKEGWGPKTRQYERDILTRLGRKAPAKQDTAGLGATAPAVGDTSDLVESAITKSTPLYDKLMPAPKREARDALLAYAKEQNSPEALEKQRSQDMWSTLAEIGFNMAGTNSPSFLQAVGAAASAALPGAKADKKAREERKREMLRTFAEVEGIDNQEAKDRVNGILKVADTQLGIKKDDIAREFTRTERIATQTFTAGQAELDRDAAMDRTTASTEQRMDKGLEGFMNSFLQMGINEAKGKGIPVDMPALKAKAYQLALAEWNKYKAQPGIEDPDGNGIPGDQRTGNVAPPQAFNPNAYVVK